MNTEVPVLVDHNADVPPVGICLATERGLEVTMADGHELTREQLFDTFGNIGAEILEMVAPKGRSDAITALLIRRFRIRAFSLDSNHA